MEEGCVESPEMTAVRGGRADLKGLTERYDRLLGIERVIGKLKSDAPGHLLRGERVVTWE